VLVDHVLELGGEVDPQGAVVRELVEHLGRERRGAVLDDAGEAVLARASLEIARMGLEVDAHLGYGPVGQDDAAVRGARVDGRSSRGRSCRRAGPPVAVHVGAKLLGGGDALPDLSDLAADGDRDPFGSRARMCRVKCAAFSNSSAAPP